MAKRALCWICVVLSNLVVVILMLRVVRFDNVFTGAILLLGPLIFTMPWLVIQRSED